MKVFIGKWFIEFQMGWRVVAFNWVWGRLEVDYYNEWHDGPHKAITIGPFNIYWNW